MSTKSFLFVRPTLLIITSLLLCYVSQGARLPNFVIIMADDLGYGDVGYQGSDVPTPNIDSIASNGVRFTNGYVTCPVCAPSRAGLLTGRYQQSFGFWDNTGPFRINKLVEPGIPTNLPILSERLKSLGYTTGFFGKSHDGRAESMMPFNRWDKFFGFNNGASNFIGDMNRKHNPIFRDKKIVSEPYVKRGINKNKVIIKGVIQRDSENYLTDQIGDQAAQFINENKDKPFLCYVPFNAVHGPFQSTQETYDKYVSKADHKRALVMAMLHTMDSNIGKIIDALDQNSLMENTLIIFLSDNGGHEFSPNEPLKGKKATFWEGGLRVPFCMQWTGRISPNTLYSEPIISLDIMPTLIAAAGGEIDPTWQLDGIDLIPFIDESVSGSPHEALYWSWGARKAIRKGKLKAISLDSGKTFELYDLEKDVGETENIAKYRQEKLQNMIEEHSKWESKLMPQQWGWNKKLGYKDPNFGEPEAYHDPEYIIR